MSMNTTCAGEPSANCGSESQDIGWALNEKARHQMRLQLLNDIRMDITVCQIEGWDYREYIIGLRDLINGLLEKEVAQNENT